MKCPACGGMDTEVFKTMCPTNVCRVRRRRICLCGARWTTKEVVERGSLELREGIPVDPGVAISIPTEGIPVAEKKDTGSRQESFSLSPSLHSPSDLSSENALCAPARGRENPEYLAWYAAYPRKEAPTEAAKAWEQTDGTHRKYSRRPSLAEMLVALEWQTRQWKALADERRPFPTNVPHPATYLRGSRWADQPLVDRRVGGRRATDGPDPLAEHNRRIAESTKRYDD